MAQSLGHFCLSRIRIELGAREKIQEARRKTMWESFARQMNYYSWFVERGRAGGDAFVCADPAVRHAADFERRLRRRSTQYR